MTFEGDEETKPMLDWIGSSVEANITAGLVRSFDSVYKHNVGCKTLISFRLLLNSPLHSNPKSGGEGKKTKKTKKYFNKLTLNFYICFVPNKVLATSDEKKAKKEMLKERAT